MMQPGGQHLSSILCRKGGFADLLCKDWRGVQGPQQSTQSDDIGGSDHELLKGGLAPKPSARLAPYHATRTDTDACARLSQEITVSHALVFVCTCLRIKARTPPCRRRIAHGGVYGWVSLAPWNLWARGPRPMGPNTVTRALHHGRHTSAKTHP
jgi:hypothetical protein